MSIKTPIQDGFKKNILTEGLSYASAATPKRSPTTILSPIKDGVESIFIHSSIDHKFVQHPLPKNNYFKYIRNIRFWLCNYSIYLQADDSSDIKQVSLALDKQNLQRVIIKDEITVHFDSNPEIFLGILHLIRVGPKCALKICARGYLDGLMKFMNTMNFTRCHLMDLKSDSIILFSEILHALKDATHIELDLQGLYFDKDIGQMLKNWNREPTIVQLIFHNMPRTVDVISLDDFLGSKLVPTISISKINWSD